MLTWLRTGLSRNRLLNAYRPLCSLWQMTDMTEKGFNVKWMIGIEKQVCTEKDTFACQKPLEVQMPSVEMIN